MFGITAVDHCLKEECVVADVWMQMTRGELDAAYDQAAYAPNRLLILARYEANSQSVRQRIGEPKRYAYGTGEKEKLVSVKLPPPSKDNE